MKYLIICMLMLYVSLSAMTSHSSRHTPKYGQLVGIIPKEEKYSGNPIMMITHYQGLETYYLIDDARKWYTCNIKDIKHMIKKDRPFYFMPNYMKGKSVAKLIDGHFLYYKYLEFSGSIAYLERIIDDMEKYANEPDKIIELAKNAREYLENIKNIMKFSEEKTVQNGVVTKLHSLERKK